MEENQTIVASPEMCALCFDELIFHLQSQSNLSPRLPVNLNRKIPTPHLKASLFVTWEIYDPSMRDFVLRGCIGTFSKPTLEKGLKKYAITSACEDNRFLPIQLDEVPKLKCSINLLHQYEYANNVYDWEIGRHGIHIFFTHPFDRRECSATYLPSVMEELGWNKDQTLKSLYRKAGYKGEITESLMKCTTLERYQSSKCSLTFNEYKEKYMNHNSSIENQGLLGSNYKLS